jgi:hypothetical protein
MAADVVEQPVRGSPTDDGFASFHCPWQPRLPATPGAATGPLMVQNLPGAKNGQLTLKPRAGLRPTVLCEGPFPWRRLSTVSALLPGANTLGIGVDFSQVRSVQARLFERGRRRCTF